MGYPSGHYTEKTAVGIAAARATGMAQVSGNGSMAACAYSFLGLRTSSIQPLTPDTLCG